MTIKPTPGLVLTELARSFGPVPGLSATAAIVVLSFVLATSTRPSRQLALALAAFGLAAVLYLAAGVLIVLNARIHLSADEVEYRDMFRRSRVCSVDAISSLSLRRIKMMNLDQGVLMFLDSGRICLMAGFGAYWPVDQVSELAKRTGAELEAGGVTLPLAAVLLSPTSGVPRSLRSPQAVQAVIGCGLVALIVIGVLLFDH